MSDQPVVWKLVQSVTLPEADGMQSAVFVLESEGKIYGVTVTGQTPLMTKGVLESMRAAQAHILKTLGLPLAAVGARLPDENDIPPSNKDLN